MQNGKTQFRNTFLPVLVFNSRMAEAPVNQSFSEPPPPYAPADPGKAPYPPSADYSKPAGPPQPAGFAVAPPPAGYTNQPPTTIITTQPAQTVTVVRVGNCPRCQVNTLYLILSVSATKFYFGILNKRQ